METAKKNSSISSGPKNLDEYRRNFANTLQKSHPDCNVMVKYPLQGNLAKVDVVLVYPDKTCEFYKITRRAGSETDIARMILYWHDLAEMGWQPVKGTLICKECGPVLKTEMSDLNEKYQFSSEPTTDSTPRFNFTYMEDPDNLPK